MNKKSNINDKGAKMTPQEFVRLVLDNDELVQLVRRYDSGMPKSKAKEKLRRFCAEVCGPHTTWEELKTNLETRYARNCAMLAVATKKECKNPTN
jgi:hypothetical protein